jgi:hypothetical protein
MFQKGLRRPRRGKAAGILRLIEPMPGSKQNAVCLQEKDSTAFNLLDAQGEFFSSFGGIQYFATRVKGNLTAKTSCRFHGFHEPCPQILTHHGARVIRAGIGFEFIGSGKDRVSTRQPVGLRLRPFFEVAWIVWLDAHLFCTGVCHVAGHHELVAVRKSRPEKALLFDHSDPDARIAEMTPTGSFSEVSDELAKRGSAC